MSIPRALLTSSKQDWETPQELFDELNKEFGFTVDVCANDKNHKCKKYYTELSDGLWYSWENEVVWCNPPYNNATEWIKKAVNTYHCLTIMLIPARTDTRWFHEYIYNKYEIRFIKGRLKFGNSLNNAPLPSMIIIIDNTGDNK